MLDHLASIVGSPEDATSEFPAADGPSVVLAVSHFTLLPLVVWALSSNSQLEVFDTLGVFVATVLFIGQVSNSNARELIHRSDRRLFPLGKWVYISMLYGHHTSAHLLVNHRFAASERDPCSAPKGESFYAFAQRAWIGSASAGFEMESRRLENRPTVSQRFSHPYYSYTFGGAASVLGAVLIGGWGGHRLNLAGHLCANTAVVVRLRATLRSAPHHPAERQTGPCWHVPFVECAALDVDLPDAGCTAPL